MSLRYKGGVLSTVPPTTSTSSAVGVWTMRQQMQAQGASEWPFPQQLDAQFNYVSMLLHGDGTNGAQNNTFLDGSTNNFTIQRMGNTTQGSFSPYGSNWSNNFVAVSDYLSIADNTALEFGAGDFTFECWINLPSLPSSGGSQNIMSKWATGQKSYIFSVFNNAGTMTLQFDYSTNGSTTATAIAANASLSANVWYHVAFVRSSTSFKIFLNGTEITSGATLSGTLFGGTAATWIGRTLSATYSYNGYISNLRVTKGGALYTSNFTPSAVPLTTTVSAGTVSLLTCQSNRFVDKSASPLTITVNGVPSIQRFNPFGASIAYSTANIGGSGYFDGTTDYLRNITGSAAFAFATGDFTLEAWVYPTYDTAATYRGILSTYDSTVGGGTGVILEIYNNNWGTYSVSGGGHIDTGILAATNTWTHVAFVRSSGTSKIYVNGVSVSSVGDTTNCGNCPFQVGDLDNAGGYSFKGYISDARIVKGTAVYTSNFTPPTSPLTAISGTSLLCNMTNGAIYDNAMMNDLETVGNAQISTSVKKYGTGSLAFDGTGDYLVAANSPIYALGSGDFTLEAWVYTATAATNQAICAKESSGTDSFLFLIGNSSGNKVALNLSSDGATYSLTLTGSTTLSINTWYHVAAVRSGSGSNNIKLYLNGVQDAQGTFSGTVYNDTSMFTVGYRQPASNLYFNGYIDDLRITKGYARYTTTFTPPTAAFPNIGPA